MYSLLFAFLLEQTSKWDFSKQGEGKLRLEYVHGRVLKMSICAKLFMTLKLDSCFICGQIYSFLRGFLLLRARCLCDQ